jgi:hypothetical protein
MTILTHDFPSVSLHAQNVTAAWLAEQMIFSYSVTVPLAFSAAATTAPLLLAILLNFLRA